MMGRLWGRWVRFLGAREPATSLALFRVGVGLVVVGAVAAVALAGAVPALWLPPGAGGYTPTDEPWPFRLIGGVTPAAVWVVVAVTLTAGLCTTLGLGGRLPPLVALQGYLALIGLNPEATGSYDLAVSNALWLLFLSRASATLSLDCRLRTGRWTSAEPVPAWPRYLVIFQLVLIYGSTGLHKMSAAWTPGGGFSALYYIAQQPTWRRWDMRWLAWAYPLTQAATAVTWVWELSAPLLPVALWLRATRDRPGRLRAWANAVPWRGVFVAVGVALHLGVLVFFEVGPFSWIMLAYYPCLYRPEEWQRLTGERGALAPRGLTGERGASAPRGAPTGG